MSDFANERGHVARNTLHLLHEAVEFFELGHRVLARPSVRAVLQNRNGFLSKLIGHFCVRRDVVHAVDEQIVRCVDARCAQDQLELCLGLVIPLLAFGERVQKPLDQIIRLLVARNLHSLQSLLDNWNEHVLRVCCILAELAKVGNQVLANGSKPRGEELQFD